MAIVKEFNNLTFKDKTDNRFSRSCRPFAVRYMNFIGQRTNSVICCNAVKKAMGYTPELLTVKVYNKNPKRKNTIKVVRVSSNNFFYQGMVGDAFSALRIVLCENDVSWIVLIDEDKK